MESDQLRLEILKIVHKPHQTAELTVATAKILEEYVNGGKLPKSLKIEKK